MNSYAIAEIVECLPKGRTVYRYFKDRYALQLLEYAVGTGMAIREIQSSQFARLLHKPTIKQVLCGAGGKFLTRQQLETYMPDEIQYYRLTLGRWGGTKEDRTYYQTTRKGQNLVLHLNFPDAHNQLYSKLIQPKDDHPFEIEDHPIAGGDERTLAWSRLDIDLVSGEALIEEVQNDWVRHAIDNLLVMEEAGENPDKESFVYREFVNVECQLRELKIYVEEILRPHTRIWAEAMLSAVLFFLVEELGVKRIFYHTFRTGLRLKHIDEDTPPMSLYSDLPERFCFHQTNEVPVFLQRVLRRRNKWKADDRFFLLEV